MKCIGFDATEDHRTYATGGGISVCPEKGLPPYGQRYEMRYPLREWGLDRAACGRIIVAAGLPLPPKSACFFCPSMKQAEIESLAVEDPTMYRLALEMERLYREGRHFRGDDAFTVKGVHKQTGEKYEMEVFAKDLAEARAIFRKAHDDDAVPHKYKIAAHSCVVGLGRSYAWNKRVPLALA